MCHTVYAPLSRANKPSVSHDTGTGVDVSKGKRSEVPVITAACRFPAENMSARINKTE